MLSFITTEPVIINKNNYIDNTIEKWQKYWLSCNNELYKQIIHLPLSSIEYLSKDKTSIQQNYINKTFDAIFFISPNAIYSYYQIYKQDLPSKNIWLIGENSYKAFCSYYNHKKYKITYVIKKTNASAKELFLILAENNQLSNNQNILVIKGNLGNNWIYEQIQTQYNANINYLITYTKQYLNYENSQLYLLDEIILKQKFIHVYISSSDILYKWKIYIEKYLTNIEIKQIIYTKHIQIKQKSQEIFANSSTKVVLIDNLV